jgi:hypothetical protein
MTNGLFNRLLISRSGMLAVLITSLAASPALAKQTAAAVDTSMCSPPGVSQPFLSANDSNWYMLSPGQTAGNFDGSGWALTGGAQIITTQLTDGQTGQVLDLPAGAQAVSPDVCVSSDYPTARTMVQSDATAVLDYAVAYAGTKAWDKKPKPLGQITGAGAGWTASDPFAVNPGTQPGWQLVRFTFESNGKNGSDAQLYDFYVDPRMGW